MSYDGRKVLVVTGTSNTGEEIVRKAAEKGAEVAFTYYSDQEAAEDLEVELEGDGHLALQCDVTSSGSVEEAVEEAAGNLGGIDAVFYTAGVIDRSPVEKTAEESWNKHLDVNLTGAFHVFKHAIPLLEQEDKASITAVSASRAITGSPNLSAYNASKHGLNALVETAAREVAEESVRVNAVAPGPIRSPEELSEGEKQDLRDSTPLGRICSPGDVASLCLFLGSGKASSITGAVVPIDGGSGL